MLRRAAPSVDLRFVYGRTEAGLEEVEVASLVRLADVLCEHPAVAPFETRLARDPPGPAPPDLLVVHQHVDAAVYSTRGTGKRRPGFKETTTSSM